MNLLTKQEIEALLEGVAQNQPRVCIAWCGNAKDDCACYKAGVAVGALNDAAPDIARTALAIMAQRDAAMAAQALVVERADIDAALDAMEANMRAAGQTTIAWRTEMPREDQDKLRACVRAGVSAALADPSGVEALAAQAMVVERAAGHIVSEGERLAEGIPNAGPGLEFLRELADEVRALADTDGEALVRELRADVKGWADNATKAWRLYLETEADRDRLAAANAALEAKVARLVGALDALRHAVCGETGFAACVRAYSGKAYPWPALDEAEALVDATLAEVQARDKGEGGE